MGACSLLDRWGVSGLQSFVHTRSLMPTTAVPTSCHQEGSRVHREGYSLEYVEGKFSELRLYGVLRISPVSIPHTAVNREWSRGFDTLAGSSPWRSYDLYVVFLRKSLSEAHGGLRVVPGSRQTLRQFL